MNTNNELKQRSTFTIEVHKKLVNYKKVNDRKNFYDLMKQIMPGVRKYIKKIFFKLVRNKQIPKGKYKVNDFIDTLYINAFDNIQGVENSENLYAWLIKQADILLEDTLIEEDFNNVFFKNIDDYTKAEWDEMEENYFIDADGDLVMEEEADDIFLPKNDYTLKDVFIENIDDDLMKTISEHMEKDQINRNIKMFAGQFSLLEYSIFELNSNHALTAIQIAEIKKIPVSKVEDLLENMKCSIKSIFRKRFF